MPFSLAFSVLESVVVIPGELFGFLALIEPVLVSKSAEWYILWASFSIEALLALTGVTALAFTLLAPLLDMTDSTELPSPLPSWSTNELIVLLLTIGLS